MMYIDGKRLDVVFAEANKLIQEKKIEESFKLTEALYTKILHELSGNRIGSIS